MANSPIVSSLPDYVEQNRGLILSTSILGGRTTQLFTKQSGVKGSAALNILSTDVQFGDGSTCGWNEAGASTLTQRILKTGLVKVNMAYCWKQFIGKWAEYQVEIKANPNKLPFEQEFTDDVVRGIQEALEKALWQGDVDSSDDNLNKFDGMLKILNDAASVTINETIAAGASTVNAVNQILLAIPAKCLKSDTVIFCSPEFLRKYKLDLVAANLYHFEPNQDIDDITIPGSNVKLVAVAGLEGQKKLIGARLSNLFYGYDFEDSDVNLDLWFSKDNDEYRLKSLFNAGVQVAFPNEVVNGTYTTIA